MSDLRLAERHRLLPARRRGDTLIVEPMGSMGGFTAAQVREERLRIERLLAEPQTTHLIIDLASSDYYGSEMIGLFVQLREACRGTTALANLSHDMDVVLQTMHLDELFDVHPTQASAVRAVARIPLRERVRIRNRFVRYVVVPTLLIVAGLVGWQGNYVYQLTGTSTQRQYEQINALWAEYHERLPEFSAAESMPREELIDDLNRQIERSVAIKNRTDDEDNLLGAMMDFRAVLQHPIDAEKRTEQFLHHMHCARNSIRRRTGLDLPKPGQLAALVQPSFNG